MITRNRIEKATSDNLLEMSLDIPRRRKNSRKYSKVTQEQIAIVLGVTISTIQRHENDNYQKLPLGMFIRLLKYLEDNGVNTNM